MPDPMEPVRRPDATAASVSLERALERARWAILWERLWPPLAALLTVIGLFLSGPLDQFRPDHAPGTFVVILGLAGMGRAVLEIYQEPDSR